MAAGPPQQPNAKDAPDGWKCIANHFQRDFICFEKLCPLTRSILFYKISSFMMSTYLGLTALKDRKLVGQTLDPVLHSKKSQISTPD